MGDFLRMELDGDWQESLDALAAEAKTTLLRSGGNAMAYQFQIEAQRQAPVFTGTAPKGAKHPPKPGQLRDSIYRVHAAQLSAADKAVYEVSWNHYKAPHGHWMEYGNSRHPAHPFIRPAYYAAQNIALQAGLDRMAEKFAAGGTT